MLDRRMGSLCTVIGFVLFSSTGCQKTIPLDTLVTKKRTNVTKKLTMNEAISQHELEYADNLYLDYRGAHPDSDKLPSMMLKLAQAHITQKEYLLARYYAEVYITDYSDGKRVDQAWFLRLKALFLRAISKGSAETLIEQFQEEAAAFIANPAYRKYHAKARAILKRSQNIQYQRNEVLALYYEKHGKKKAAAFYRDKNKALKLQRKK